MGNSCIINIGTSKGNIQNVEIKAPFEMLTRSIVENAACKHLDTGHFTVFGWAKSK